MRLLSEPSRWVEINLTAIRHNYQQIRERLKPGVRLLGVVKADAYGCGMVEVSRALAEAGADMLGVTTVVEGLTLRAEGINLPILVFGPFLPEEAGSIAANDLTASIASLDQIEWLGQAAVEHRKIVNVHLKVETGLGRTGLWTEELIEAAERIKQYENLLLDGIYSHLATAAELDSSYVKVQARIFLEAVSMLDEAGYTELIRHIANSAAILKYPDLQLDMVRTGTLLYGQLPSAELAGAIQLQDPWRFLAKVIYLKELPAGYSVGYGRTFKTKKISKIAIIPVGFTDGLQMEPVLRPVNLLELMKGLAKLVLQFFGHSSRAVFASFPDGQGRIIGKIGMQLSVVDVTGIDEVRIGSAAELPLRRTAVNPLTARMYISS